MKHVLCVDDTVLMSESCKDFQYVVGKFDWVYDRIGIDNNVSESKMLVLKKY